MRKNVCKRECKCLREVVCYRDTPASENNKTTVPTDKPQSLFWVAGWVLHEREEGQAIQFLGQLCVHALHKLGLQSK